MPLPACLCPIHASGHQAIAGFSAGIGCAGDDSVDAVGEGSLAREEVVIAVHGKAQEQLIPQARVEHHAVGSGEDVEITRLAAGFDLDAFLSATTNKPMHQGTAVSTLREEARY